MFQQQVVITYEQVPTIVEAVGVPVVTWLVKRMVKSLKEGLNEIITENVNRIRDELQQHIETKFQEHEDNAFSRITNLENQVKGIKS